MGAARNRTLSRYDFRRPRTFNRDHARVLQIAAESFARQWTTLLSLSLRAVSLVTVRSVEQLTYEEYLDRIPNPTYLGVLSLPPLPGTSLLHLPLRLVMTMVDRLVGGPGGVRQPSRPVTEIEATLVGTLLGRVLQALAQGFEGIAPLAPDLVGHEANPQFAQMAALSDMVVVIELDVRVGGSEGVASLCIPFKALQPVLDELTGRATDDHHSADPVALRQSLEDRLDDVPLPVSVRFAEATLTAVELAALRPGDLVDLHHHVDAPLEVAVSGIARFWGRAGRRGQRLACEVVDAPS